MYQSQLFKAQLKYAESLNPDRIMVLSAGFHGPIPIDQSIDPYDKTLKDMSAEEVRSWARINYNVLTTQVNPNGSEFIFLAGKDYRDELSKLLGQHPGVKIEVPLEGLGIGTQLKELKELNKPETEGEMGNRLVENITKADYPVGTKYFYSGFEAKVTGIETREETGGRPRVLLEYIEGPLKGQATDAPGHLKVLERDLIEPFDIQTTQGTVRLAVDWALGLDKYQEIYEDNTAGIMSVELHGPNVGAPNIKTKEGFTTAPRGRYRSAAGVPVHAERPEQLRDPAWIKDTATMIANSVLADHFGVPTRIVGRPPDTMGEVLERSRDPTPDATELTKIKIIAEVGDEKVSHMAKWWVDAYDKRLEAVAKLRTCV